MPPVLGPVSPLPSRLKSCAGASGTTCSPSVMQNNDTSGPSRYSSTTTGAPAARHRCACARASSRSSVTTTPLPAASPSSLTTYGAPSASSASAPRRRSRRPGPRGRDLGRGHHLLGEGLAALELRRLAAGAEAGDPARRARRRRRRPPAGPRAHDDQVGPQLDGQRRRPRRRRAVEAVAQRASASIPGLPGAAMTASTAGSAPRAATSACSRAPDRDENLHGQQQ